MTTDPHIYKGEYCNLHIRPSDAPESVEVEVFSQKRKNGLWIEVPVAKVRSMLAASVLPGSYTRTAEQPRTPTPTTDEIEAVLHDVLPLTTARLGDEDIAEIAFNLHAALTEPTRPEGAEELDDHIAGMDINLMPETVYAYADFLAERGVRVVTEERS